MRIVTSSVVVVSGLLMLGGCATVPTGPSVMALPGTGRSFDQFRLDDYDCRQFAYLQVGGPEAEQAANDEGVRAAAVGTLIGAVAGAMIGGRQGAAVGAGSGLLIGSASGAGASGRRAYGSQRAYDNAYLQCMYAKSHKVPVGGGYVSQPPPAVSVPAGAAVAIPPPPPGNPPPPPPSAR